MKIVLYVIALIGPLIAVIFGTHAGWSVLAAYYTPWHASGAVALAYLLLSSLAAILLLNSKSSPPEKIAASSAAGFAAPVRLLETAMRESPWKTLGILVGFGALVAQKPQLVVNLIEAVTRQLEE